jgi:hypothetical protein
MMDTEQYQEYAVTRDHREDNDERHERDGEGNIQVLDSVGDENVLATVEVTGRGDGQGSRQWAYTYI